MSCYIIAFEIKNVAKRPAFEQKLKSYGYFCPINSTCWAIVTEKTAQQVRDELLPLIETNDHLFVVRSGTEAAWWNAYGEKNNEWLKKYL